MPSSLHRDVTVNYYATTAARGHQASKDHYDNAVRHWRPRLAAWFPAQPTARCLDLACGCGEVVYVLEQEGYEAVGVDLCYDELEQARPFLSGKLVHADIQEFLRSQPSESWDFITALNILEHLTKDDLGSVLNEAHRVLKPGGTLVAMVPNAISPFGGVTRHWDITHEWAFTPNNFQQLAALVGFAPAIDVREWGPYPHGVVSTLRYLLWQIIRAGIATWFLIEVANTKGGVYTMDMLVRLHKK